MGEPAVSTTSCEARDTNNMHRETGHVNRGGSKVRCEDGDIVLVGETPNCEIISMF